jgi:hypothetical protein
MPIDFLNEDRPAEAQSMDSGRDFLNEDSAPEKESFGASLRRAIPRIGTDLYHKAYQGFQAIPSYLQKAKTEAPGLLSLVNQHPLHLAMQGLAGANEAINSLAQTPLNLAQYGANRLNLLPQSVPNAIAKMTPEDTTQAINQLFGDPRYSGEAAVRGAFRNALPLIGGVRLMEGMPHLTNRGATRNLNTARELANGRNIGNLNVDPALIEDARQFLPNTLPYRNTYDAAQGGDYNNLFRLQSDVGQNASDYAKSLFSAAERSHGRAGLGARNRLLDAIHENLRSQGHEDISDLLRQGQNDYRRYRAFRPYRNILAATALGSVLPTNSLLNIGKKILLHKPE